MVVVAEEVELVSLPFLVELLKRATTTSDTSKQLSTKIISTTDTCALHVIDLFLFGTWNIE